MRNNPHPDDPASAQPADIIARVGRMEDIPLKQALPQPTPLLENTQDAESAEVRQEEARTVKYAISKLNDFLQWFVAVLEITLLIRFIFKLIAADQNNLFAGFIYALTSIILYPFYNIVHSSGVKGSIFEWPTVIAMAIYWLIFWGIRRFLRIIISGPEEASS